MAGSTGFSFSTTPSSSSSPAFGFPTASSASPFGFGSSSSGFGSGSGSGSSASTSSFTPFGFGFGSSASNSSSTPLGFATFATTDSTRAFSFGGVCPAPSSTGFGAVRFSFGSGSSTPTPTPTPAVTTSTTTNSATTDTGTSSASEVPFDDPSRQDTSTAQTKSRHIPEVANTSPASEIFVDEPSCRDTSTTQTKSPHISARNALSSPESMATNAVETTKDTGTLSASEVPVDEPYRLDTSSTQNDSPVTPEAVSAAVEKLRRVAMKFSSLGRVGGDPSLASVRDQIRMRLKELVDRPILFDKYDDLMVTLDQFKAQTAVSALPGALSRIDCLKEVLTQAQSHAQSYRNKAPALHQAEQAGANVVACINKAIARINEPQDKATRLRERRTKLSIKVTCLEAQLARTLEKLQGTKAEIETINAELPSIDQELVARHTEVQTFLIASNVELDKATRARLERQELQLQLSQLAQQAFQYMLVLDDM